MHSRFTRPVELARNAPRRCINLTQKSAANGDIDTVSGPLQPAGTVVTGYCYGHASFGGGLDWVTLGLNEQRLSGTVTSSPTITAPYGPAFSNRFHADAHLNHDKNLSGVSCWMQTPLNSPQAFPVHIWEGSSFAGSYSQHQLRAPLPGETRAPGPTRTPPPSGAAPAPGSPGAPRPPTPPRSGWPTRPVTPSGPLVLRTGGGGSQRVLGFRGTNVLSS